ncbi:hypothetical protein [Thiothrix lacustris]|uniref:hypothetical protein n=1 Tax=Thiothrix lacustris TaxID=525917 RepID=UPI0012EB0B41|nr:hypothetical protein [Thiothrix lacustris]
MNKIFYKSLIILAIFSQAGCATQALYSEKNAPKIAKVTPDGVSETTVKAALTPVTLAVEAVEKPSEPPFCGIIRHRKHPNE